MGGAWVVFWRVLQQFATGSDTLLAFVVSMTVLVTFPDIFSYTVERASFFTILKSACVTFTYLLLVIFTILLMRDKYLNKHYGD